MLFAANVAPLAFVTDPLGWLLVVVDVVFILGCNGYLVYSTGGMHKGLALPHFGWFIWIAYAIFRLTSEDTIFDLPKLEFDNDGPLYVYTVFVLVVLCCVFYFFSFVMDMNVVFFSYFVGVRCF